MGNPFSGAYVKDILGNFSQMSMHEYTNYNFTGTSSSSMFPPGQPLYEISSGAASYVVVGHPLMNGVQYTEINFSQTANINGSEMFGRGGQNESGTIYFDPYGNASILVSGNSRYTGIYAQEQALPIMLPFELTVIFSNAVALFGGAGFPGFKVINQTTIKLEGNLTMNVTNYNVTAPASSQYNYSSSHGPPPGCSPATQVPLENITGYFTIQIGRVPNTNISVLTFLDEYYSSPQSGSMMVEYQILSLQLANNTTSTETTHT